MIKKISLYIISVVSILIFLLSILIIIFGTLAIKNNTIVKVFGYSYSIVATESMLPVIEKGEIIIIKSIPFEEVSVDDIVVYKSDKFEIHIVHRVFEIDDNGFLITKGDNNTSIDEEKVSEDNYHGIVIYHDKLLNIGGFVLKDRNLIFFIIFIFFIGILIYELASIIKTLKDKVKKEYQAKLNLEKQNILEKEREKIKQEMIEELNKGKTSEN